jgi:hypothetical protein
MKASNLLIDLILSQKINYLRIKTFKLF